MLFFSLFIIKKLLWNGTLSYVSNKFLTIPTSWYTFVVVLQLLSCVQLIVTPWTTAHQASLSFTVSWSVLKFMPIESVMLSNCLIFCLPLLLLPSIFPSIRVFSNEVSSLHQVAKVLELQLQHQSFQWTFRVDLF